MATSYAPHDAQPASRGWPSWPLITALLVLFLGPLIAPLFEATRLPLVADSGTLAHDLLARYVCPTPAKSYLLLGRPMAVCARCWGATIGLWGAWFVLRSQAVGRRSQDPAKRQPPTATLAMAFGRWYVGRSWVVKVGLALGPLLLWRLEIDAWPAAPLAVLLANGASGGFWAALCIGWLFFAARSPAGTLFGRT